MSKQLSVGDTVQAKIVGFGRVLELGKTRDGVAGATVRFTPIGAGFPMDVWCSLDDIDKGAAEGAARHHFIDGRHCNSCDSNEPHEVVNWPGVDPPQVICPS